ncbi:hypothetical protein CYLTODRAFT_458797 [Cylindrobasidium torrendii FP15055 ss-10]|uniref:Uncharacterized protein n=1 Tax=Cylindrobasidium torrendii FP15055 ss-10 TaxID=1314674 RepID=A0A0D7AW88_9AGAR|nr:hypothetical protein CYLTODRAFT_458797 [Cylindrobasidium torrendii FP15055 ss-10]
MTFYTEDCVSLSREFVGPISRGLFARTTDRMLHEYATAAGLLPGELQEWMNSPIGTLSLQPTIWKAMDTDDFVFMPPDAVLHAIARVYEQNLKRELPERLRVDQIPVPQEAVYTAHGSEYLNRAPIFTRHPETGRVTTHLPPYTDLPTFCVRTAHPSLMAARARIFVPQEGLSEVYPLIRRLARLSHRVDPIFMDPSPPTSAPINASADSPVLPRCSKKRKAVDIPLPSTKRQKVATGLRTPVTRATRAIRSDARFLLGHSQGQCCPPLMRTYYPRRAKHAAMAAMAPPAKRSRRTGR